MSIGSAPLTVHDRADASRFASVTILGVDEHIGFQVSTMPSAAGGRAECSSGDFLREFQAWCFTFVAY